MFGNLQKWCITILRSKIKNRKKSNIKIIILFENRSLFGKKLIFSPNFMLKSKQSWRPSIYRTQALAFSWNTLRQSALSFWGNSNVLGRFSSFPSNPYIIGQNHYFIHILSIKSSFTKMIKILMINSIIRQLDYNFNNLSYK